MNYYISDLHLGHENIIRLCNRPFKTVEEMDETLIENWNKVVGNDDHVYVGGDVIFKSKHGGADYYLGRLKGHKHLIIGNHDAKSMKEPSFLGYFESVDHMMTVSDGGKKIILCHYPIVEWDGFFRGTYHFYGHIHNNKNNDAYKIMSKINNAYNIGADVLEFTPRTADEIIKKYKGY